MSSRPVALWLFAVLVCVFCFVQVASAQTRVENGFTYTRPPSATGFQLTYFNRQPVYDDVAGTWSVPPGLVAASFVSGDATYLCELYMPGDATWSFSVLTPDAYCLAEPLFVTPPASPASAASGAATEATAQSTFEVLTLLLGGVLVVVFALGFSNGTQAV